TPSPPGAAAAAEATAPPDHQAPVTVVVPLPVGEATEYELRRISEIKYFEAAENGQGYAVDILASERDHLRELLARRGLTLPADWEG
ncbi:MAG TPA: hypothetical protein VLN90_00915, partial [Thioalkalivibrio sp.]|nr:hypothetical protein [Thioalkalivibrio sp.]